MIFHSGRDASNTFLIGAYHFGFSNKSIQKWDRSMARGVIGGVELVRGAFHNTDILVSGRGQGRRRVARVPPKGVIACF